MVCDPAAMDRRALLGLAAPLACGLAAVSASPVRAAGPTGGGPSDNTYVRFPTVTATIMRRDGRRGTMTVETGVDVPDAALRLRAEQAAPRLRAAYNTVVQRNAAQILPGGPPDVERLSRELQAATNTVLGRAGARLLLGTVMVV